MNEKKKVNTVFTIKDAYEEPFSETDNGQKLTSGKFTIMYQGELEGEGVLMELKNYISDSMASIYGLERINCTIGDKKGSFVFEHHGQFINGILSSRRVIMYGSGTDDLKGIEGEALFSSGGATEFRLSLEYYFE